MVTNVPGLEQRVAFITGVSGQDGSYLAELLLEKNYLVHGLARRRLLDDQVGLVLERLRSASVTFRLHYGDLTDTARILQLLQEIEPDEVYNLAALSHVSVSFQIPVTALNVNAIGTMNLLQCIVIAKLEKKTKLYQASTSEMFGNHGLKKLDENTPFQPVSPYAIGKLAAHLAAKSFRESRGMFIVSGFLFNHESPRRGRTFITRRITLKVAQMSLGLAETLVVANLDTTRDWGHARDYVQAMWLMMQCADPQDFVIATGQSHSVRTFIELAFQAIGKTIRWKGCGSEERGYLDHETQQASPTPAVVVDPSLESMRSSRVTDLCGDASKAASVLRWRPSWSFKV
ncbi:GDP-mannose 4,6-dehydratase [Lentithecium fluviatile CBS 122367]|uniref:GDP-mannose 4,6-dehydratase n=1 Tax=Lentithecium fluviatile CBS 122367 TaxID=1168545 RepID=A0A6G1IP35_9PLEO|nr:GDP-mannose 4,6-dehydratase [Lentithecium fluviatile CBS 122367]